MNKTFKKVCNSLASFRTINSYQELPLILDAINIAL
ncbi:MAG: hypothetical protein [Bacteriophage sp.]|nr:MAG: hypothetical protein [Bacteriophage sp.]